MKVPNLKAAKVRNKEAIKVIKDEYIIPDAYKSLGKDKKYYIHTYGCQMNVRDSETLKAILEDMSFIEANDQEVADLILLNTCAIRENAHNKVFGMLGRIKHLKGNNPHLIIGLCGCMAQEEIVIDKILKNYKWLDFVFGTHNMHKLPQILATSIEQNRLEVDVWSKEGDIIEDIPVKRDNKYKAWVNIMYGCDKFCTYCIVPYTRGKQRSRRPEDIIREVNILINDGYQEITLLGQNVNAYGKDFTDLDYHMEDLLKSISKTGISRLRFITSHPWDFTDEMINVIKENKNIMPYFHLPMQSGSNRILRLMGRKYTKEDYLNLFHKIRESIPDASITTDIIVGFPGETEEDYNETIDVVNKCKFDGAFTFIYSPREGTPAAKMKDDVDMETKQTRLYALNKLINQYSLKSNQKLLNKTVPVLIEDYSDKNKESLMGYTDTFKLVNVKGNPSMIGQIIDVKITEAKSWSLDGEIINEKN